MLILLPRVEDRSIHLSNLYIKSFIAIFVIVISELLEVDSEIIIIFFLWFLLFVGEGIGTILGGLFYERYGARNLFRTMAAACLCILIAYKIFCCFFEAIKPGSGGKPTETSNEPAVREAEEGQNQPQN